MLRPNKERFDMSRVEMLAALYSSLHLSQSHYSKLLHFLRSTHYCHFFSIDATREDGTLGRLINHSVTQANVLLRIIEIQRKPRLYFEALRDLTSGEELLYDYGERHPSILSANPWLRK